MPGTLPYKMLKEKRMSVKQIDQGVVIFEALVGSHLYGTSIETSDKDYVGVFLPAPEYIIGLRSVNEVPKQ